MSVIDDIKNKRQINPLLSLVAILLVAIIFTLTSFTLFWHSETKNTVQSIQRANKGFGSPQIIASGLDEDNSSLSVSDLLFIKENLNTETNKLNPSDDFGGNELDKSIIGF